MAATEPLLAGSAGGSIIFSPKTHLVAFTLTNFFIYAERGISNGIVPILLDAFNVSQEEAGFMTSIAVLGFMLGAVSAGPLQRLVSHPLKIMAAGMFCMCFGAAWMSSIEAGGHFKYILASRFFNGIGEALLCTLAPPILDDVAPEGQKSTYIGYYFTAIPIGMALGTACTFVFDSWATAAYLFRIMAVIWFGFAWLFYKKQESFSGGNQKTVSRRSIVMRRSSSFTGAPFDFDEVSAGLTRSSTSTLGKTESSVKDQVWRTLTSVQWLLHTLGYGMQTWFLGGASAWAVQYISIVYLTKAQLVIGAGTVAVSLVGSSLGGFALDYLNVSRGWNRLKACCLLTTVFMGICVPLGYGVPLIPQLNHFYALFFLMEFFIVSTMAPINLGIMESVTPGDRGTALGLATLGMHIFGDVPSNIVYGMVADEVTKASPGFSSDMSCTFKELSTTQGDPVSQRMLKACQAGQRAAMTWLCYGVYGCFLLFSVALCETWNAPDELFVELGGRTVLGIELGSDHNIITIDKDEAVGKYNEGATEQKQIKEGYRLLSVDGEDVESVDLKVCKPRRLQLERVASPLQLEKVASA